MENNFHEYKSSELTRLRALRSYYFKKKSTETDNPNIEQRIQAINNRISELTNQPIESLPKEPQTRRGRPTLFK